MPKTKKSGKKMNFSQAVIGTSSRRSGKKKGVGMIVTGSAGKVNKSPSKPKAPRLRGKRIY